MKKFSTLFLFVFPVLVSAQNVTVKGIVSDTTAKKALAYATVSLIKASDLTLVTFTRADSSGYFQLKSVQNGSYRLSGFLCWL